VEEGGIAGSIRGLKVNVPFNDILRCVNGCRGGEASSYYEAPACGIWRVIVRMIGHVFRKCIADSGVESGHMIGAWIWN